MNPFLYPALIVLCVCSIATRQILSMYRSMGSDRNPIALFLFAIPRIASVWTIAAFMLVSIGLGAMTGTGARGAVVTTVVATVLVAYVIYRDMKKATAVERASRAEE